MTYKELKREINVINVVYEKQLEILDTGESILIRDAVCDDYWYYARISNRIPFVVYTNSLAFESLNRNLRHDLLKTVCEFALTLINARHLQKRYQLRARLIADREDSYLYKYGGGIDKLGFNVESNIDTQFTKEEIDEIKEKYNTDLKDFDIIEVEE